jgi:hypothetical protein
MPATAPVLSSENALTRVDPFLWVPGQSERPHQNFETVTLESYSYRKAIIGSTEDARRAGR